MARIKGLERIAEAIIAKAPDVLPGSRPKIRASRLSEKLRAGLIAIPHAPGAGYYCEEEDIPALILVLAELARKHGFEKFCGKKEG